MTHEKLCTIALNTLPGMRAAAFHRLRGRFGSAAGILRAGEEALLAAGCGPETAAALRGLPAEPVAEAELRGAAACGVRVVTWEEPGYPARLRHLADPPPVLYVAGELLADDAAAIAVVGSRSATPYGLAVAGRLARELASLGVTVVSGLARGIDAEAHRGALEGGGRTVAVLGAGLDRVYPPEHRRLAERVAGHGALVSEFALGTRPEPWHFPLRNRLISGLSLGVVVVEAAHRSGALITADLALEQGREVFAVPGNVTSARSAGTNRLIKQGAKLVEDAGDILEDFPALAALLPAADAPAAVSTAPSEGLARGERALLDSLGGDPMAFDDLARASRLTAQDAAAGLTALELKGMVRRLPGTVFARC